MRIHCCCPSGPPPSSTLFPYTTLFRSLTLWHLLSRVSDADRPGVYDRLAALAPPPAGVTREGILRLDRQMLDSWWNSLGFGDVFVWRTFEHNWSDPPLNAK